MPMLFNVLGCSFIIFFKFVKMGLLFLFSWFWLRFGFWVLLILWVFFSSSLTNEKKKGFFLFQELVYYSDSCLKAVKVQFLVSFSRCFFNAWCYNFICTYVICVKRINCRAIISFVWAVLVTVILLLLSLPV